MNATKNTFSLTRLGLLLKREYSVNWKQHVYRLLAIYGTFLVTLFMTMLTNDPYTPSALTIHHFTEIVAFICGVVSMVYLSQMMKPMETKTSRINYLMLPATNAEKFVSRLLMATVGFWITAIVALAFATASRYIFMPFMYVNPDLYHPIFGNVMAELFDFSCQIHDIKGIIMSNFEVGMFVVMLVIWGYTIYMLGGNIWYKNAFIKTVAAMTVITILGNIVLISLISAFGITKEDFTILLNTATGVFTVLAIVNIWLSYRLFRRAQVIRNLKNML
ncbi:MAG: hypothetical protein SPJ71_03625 [Candidatus Limisoma sp.]|nr:hypothetical protein [Bacteroidales bacterium]MDY5893652.1 hypothetical protein [Candidatus Limisoma sp.]